MPVSVGRGSAPLVYSIDYHENGQLLLEACRQVDCSGFNLVTISGLHWNQELSPWPIETVVSKDDKFTGEARGWLTLFTGEVVPQVERPLDAPPSWRQLAGYSMAGLFGPVWTAFQTDLFSRILSASGSMWYPSWLEYAQKQELASELAGSLFLEGRQGEHLAQCRAADSGRTHLGHGRPDGLRGIPSKFELNPGNHFKNPPLRVAKGLKWLLQHEQQ